MPRESAPSATRVRTDARASASDEQLAARVTRGDPEAFGELYERYYRPLYRYSLRIVGNPEDARDVLQTTMLNAYRALARGPRELAVRPWLYRIAHNAAVSQMRSQRCHESLVDDVPSHRTTVDGAADRERLANALSDLSVLPARSRDALALRAFLALDYIEIGGRLAMTPGAARQAVSAARSALDEREHARTLVCDDISAQITSGDGRRLRSRRLSMHLAACERCRELASSVRAAGRRVVALPSLILPGRFGISQLFGRAETLGTIGGSAGAALGAKAAGLVIAVSLGTGAIAAHGVGTGARSSSSQGAAPAPTASPTLASSGVAVEAAAVSERPMSHTEHAETAGPGEVAGVAPNALDDSPGGASDGVNDAATAGVTGEAPNASGIAGGQHASSGSDPRDDASGTGTAGAGNGSGAGPEGAAAGTPSGPNGAPGQDGTPPGHGGTPPGHGGTPPGQGGGAPGNSADAPGQGDQGSGESGAPGNSANAPGHADASPAHGGGHGGKGESDGESPGHANDADDGGPGGNGQGNPGGNSDGHGASATPGDGTPGPG